MSHPIVFGEPQFGDAEEQAVLDVLRSRWVGHGPVVARFERALATRLDAPDAVAVSSCSAALELALQVAGVGPGDEVVTTPLTFVATLNAIDRVGATPVLVDIDPVTLNITPASVAAACTARTRAVVPVHFGGHPVDVTGFDRLCARHDLWLVEDAAHAIGARTPRGPVGHPRHDRDLTCFSFYANKNVASNDGGAVTVRDPALAERIGRLRQHGLDLGAWSRFAADPDSSPVPDAVERGQKATWTDLQAAIAEVQLGRLDESLAAREALAAAYDAELVGVPGVWVRPRPLQPGERHALHLYQVEVEGGRARRDAVLVELRAHGVYAAVHYLALHLHRAHRGRWTVPLPAAEHASEHLLTLPLHPGMHADDVTRVAEALRAVAR